MKNKIAEIKQNKKVMACFISIIVIRIIIFFSMLPIPITDLDAKEYIAIDGFAAFGLVFNRYRTPLYPLVIEIFETIIGSGQLMLFCVSLLQLVVSCISSIYLYFACKNVCKNNMINLGITLMYSTNLSIAGWDRTTLTESFALSLTIFLIFNLTEYIARPNMKSIIYLSIISFAGTMLRPTFAGYAGLTFGFFILRYIFCKKERKIILRMSAVIALPAVLILGYATIFNYQHGQFSLSSSLTAQQITVFAESGIYTVGDNQEIIKTIEENLKPLKGDKTATDAAVRARHAVMNKYDIQEVSEFVSSIRIGHFKDYISVVIQMFSGTSKLNFFAYYNIENPVVSIILSLFITELNFFQGMMLTVVAGVLWVYDCIKKKHFNWVLFGVVFCVTYTYVISIFGTNTEFPRTAITVLPFINLALCIFFDRAVAWFKGDINV